MNDCTCNSYRNANAYPSGTGYIGSFTALALLEANYKVVIVDNSYNSDPEVLNRIQLITGKKPEYYKVDITNERELDEVFAQHPDIDNVIHFAALKVRKDSNHGVVGVATCRTNQFIGRRRVGRDPTRVLPCQCGRHTFPPAIDAETQRH